MTVTRITEEGTRETIAALEDLLQRARAGQIYGIAFSIKTGPKQHRIGFTGEYWRDPVQLLGCVTRMEYKVNHIISDRDNEHDTMTMPL